MKRKEKPCFGEFFRLLQTFTKNTVRLFMKKCQESATSGSQILKSMKLDHILSHHLKQEQTTWTKRSRQKLKAEKKGSMLHLLCFLPARQVVPSRNILKNGHCVKQHYQVYAQNIFIRHVFCTSHTKFQIGTKDQFIIDPQYL